MPRGGLLSAESQILKNFELIRDFLKLTTVANLGMQKKVVGNLNSLVQSLDEL
jgi:hypothetical protein